MRGHAMQFNEMDPRALKWLAMTGRGGRHGGGPRHHGRGPDGPPFGFGGMGRGPGGPGGPGFGRRRRMGRGDVRAAILVLLDEQARNGYGLMQEIEQRSEGAWRPSPGSVYPALSQLEDEGLVRSTESDGRKQFELTDEGRKHVEEHREGLGSPWEAARGDVREGAFELRDQIWQLASAAQQVVATGSQAQVAKAKDVLAEARRSLYRILAEDEPPTDTEQPTDER